MKTVNKLMKIMKNSCKNSGKQKRNIGRRRGLRLAKQLKTSLFSGRPPRVVSNNTQGSQNLMLQSLGIINSSIETYRM